MGGLTNLLWLTGYIVSVAFLVASITRYRKYKKSKVPIVISAITSFVFGVPIALFMLLLIGLGTGLMGM